MSGTVYREPVHPSPGVEEESPARVKSHAALQQGSSTSLLPAPGQTLAGRYTVLAVLGQGGMGVVLAAYDARLDRRVALKLLLPSKVGLGRETEWLQARLVREAQALARLSHPHVVAVYDSGTLEDGRLFLAMEYVQGHTLRQWLKEKPRSWREVLRAYVAAGRGLAAAHAAGLIHRDFKPDNVLVGTDGRVRVTDFGVVRANTDSTVSDSWAPTPPQAGGGESPPLATAQALSQGRWETALTLPGNVLGTLGYLAPELLQGQAADARSDLFAFSVALYEALYGQPAFGSGQGKQERLKAQLAGQVNPPPARSEVPRWVTRRVLQGLREDPRQRPASMEALLSALEADPAERRQVRLKAAAVAMGVLAMGGLTVGAWWQPPGPTCAQVARTRLAGVWDEPVKAQVRAALLGTGLSYAQATSERVEAALARYAERWVRLRTQACEAGQAQEEQARRLAILQVDCLERRRSQLQAYTELLARGPDKELVAQAAQGVQGLAPLAYCTDAEALTAAVPPPEDPKVRARVEALQVQVDRLDALYKAGKFREGVEQGDRLLVETEGVGFEPLHARALYQAAMLRYGAGDAARGDVLARKAILLAAKGREDVVVAGAWNHLVLSVGGIQGHHEKALGMRLAMEAAAARAGDAGVRAGSLNTLAILFERVGRYEEARELQERALDIQEKALGPEHPEVAASHHNLGILLRALGQHEQARARYERASVILEKALGPEHPNVAQSLTSLGVVLRDLGQYERSRELQERALAIREKALGKKHRHVANSLSHLALLMGSLGQYERSRELQERALAIREEVLGPEHSDVVASLHYLGLVLREEGQYAQARELQRRALAMGEKAMGREHPMVVLVQIELGRTLVHLGEWEASRRHLEHAMALDQKLTGRYGPWRVSALLGMGALQCKRGLAAQAVPLLERALALALPRDQAEVQRELAHALWVSGVDRPRAQALITQAREHYQRLGHAPGLAQTSRWLAAHPLP